jgi:hypothetical protein
MNAIAVRATSALTHCNLKFWPRLCLSRTDRTFCVRLLGWVADLFFVRADVDVKPRGPPVMT